MAAAVASSGTSPGRLALETLAGLVRGPEGGSRAPPRGLAGLVRCARDSGGGGGGGDAQVSGGRVAPPRPPTWSPPPLTSLSPQASPPLGGLLGVSNVRLGSVKTR